MKGFVPTPMPVVDQMVDKLFAKAPPSPADRVLDPGCGPGAFIAGVLQWCDQRGTAAPQIVGVEADSSHVTAARRQFAGRPNVEIRHASFLCASGEQFDYIVGNPPYVSILGLSEDERQQYRTYYRTATNRFDLYVLFFEQALRQLKPNGRLVFITPEKFLYVESARALRKELTAHCVEELHFLPEDTFADLVTYPLVTTISRQRSSNTRVISREGARHRVALPSGGQSWLPAITNGRTHHGATLADIALRISCGVATGADREFVVAETQLSAALRPFAYRTISGRQLRAGRDPTTTERLLVPYDRNGRLLPETALGALGAYLAEPKRKSRLLARTCVRAKPWYAFHENPPLRDLLRPKLLCKDIASAPHFFLDRVGTVVPRHSVYYVVPRNPHILERLAAYLNSDTARRWLMQNCQRAAKGFVRLQSHVLKQLPLPPDLGDQLTLGTDVVSVVGNTQVATSNG